MEVFFRFWEIWVSNCGKHVDCDLLSIGVVLKMKAMWSSKTLATTKKSYDIRNQDDKVSVLFASSCSQNQYEWHL
jgi:hypothetical protein